MKKEYKINGLDGTVETNGTDSLTITLKDSGVVANFSRRNDNSWKVNGINGVSKGVRGTFLSLQAWVNTEWSGSTEVASAPSKPEEKKVVVKKEEPKPKHSKYNW